MDANKRIFIWSGLMKSVFDFECASFGEFAFSAWGLGQYILAVVAGDHGLGVAENDSGLVASSALDVHKIGVWWLD